ncbi:DUF2513 domain-containing protein [Providencia rettgeri]|uniref:DUF2513 domain-containing protein n=1 Tax=Providencia rettgeri TaxID=587 RepID=UPI0023608784|nr:DUF2513 domain-containing protein [Providencia rettgeri]
MKPNYDIIKELLGIFLKSDRTFLTIDDLIACTDSGVIDENFIFHFLLIVENGLISNKNLTCCSPGDVGLSFDFNGNIIKRQLPIRITQNGIDFANALNQKPVLERIKNELSDAPFAFVKTVASKLFSKILSEKLGID